MSLDRATRRQVRQRAADQCEYCQRRQSDSLLIPLQVEHVLPRKHGGGDEIDNLALACAECNLHKGSDLSGIDPESSEVTRLFDPRQDNWNEHFNWHGLRIVGLTAIGRTTVRVLQMNATARLKVRLVTRRSKPD
ncbi:MAG: HNH endonuclease [Pirellulales bacterium]|nr:HNH endonuclease [Pirellulales bacterium]